MLQNFEETVRFNEATGTYQVRLHWKDNTMSLPSNLGIRKKQLCSLLNRLNKDGPDCIEKYDEAIREQRGRGFIKKVDDTCRVQGILHYIPHLPAFNEDSATTKMRIVYNASAKGKNKTPSMNDCLQTGPCLLKALLGILLRFCKTSDKRKLERTQERALRAVYNSKTETYQELLKRAELPTLENRRLQDIAVIMYKVKNDMAPRYISKIFQPKSSRYNLRNGDFNIDR